MFRNIGAAALGAAIMTTGAMAEGRLLVVNKAENSVFMIDPDSGEQLARFATAPNPHEVAVSPDGATAYVSDYGGSYGQSITVLDLEAGAVSASWSLAEFVGPHGIWASPDGAHVWVTAERSNAIVELDAQSGSIVRSFDTGQPASHQMAASEDGNRLYVANIIANSVSAIDRTSGEVTRIEVGARPEAIDVSPDGGELWVGHNQDHTIKVIDTGSLEVIETFASGGQVPIRLQFSPDGERVYVSNAASARVTVFDAATREIIGSVDVGAVPVGILVTPDGDRVFVANTQDDFVTVIDARTLDVAGRITTGDEPDGLAWAELD